MWRHGDEAEEQVRRHGEEKQAGDDGQEEDGVDHAAHDAEQGPDDIEDRSGRSFSGAADRIVLIPFKVFPCRRAAGTAASPRFPAVVVSVVIGTAILRRSCIVKRIVPALAIAVILLALGTAAQPVRVFFPVIGRGIAALAPGRIVVVPRKTGIVFGDDGLSDIITINIFW